MPNAERVVISSKPGSFFLVSRAFGKLHLLDTEGREFSVAASEERRELKKRERGELRRKSVKLRPLTPVELLPTRAPVESDLPWQAFLRQHGTITACTHPNSAWKVLDRLHELTGLVYSEDNSAIETHNSAWKAVSFRILWQQNDGLPEGLPLKPRTETGQQARYAITNNDFVSDLLRLGLPFGYGARQS